MSKKTTASSYASPAGGLPAQSGLLTGRAVFTNAYAVIPRDVMRDIVTSNLPHWQGTRAWVLARPLSGFAESFSQYAMEVSPGGGSSSPEPDPSAQGAIFVTSGKARLVIGGKAHTLQAGSFAYLAPGETWSFANNGKTPVNFQWIRKAYEECEGIERPQSFVTDESRAVTTPMPDTDGRWATTRFIDPADMRYDMHVNIVTFEPGAIIPFAETHVMEHGLYVLEGKAVYRLNADWVEVEAGDFMWLRAFCPQACYAGGPGRFRYLLYKNVNRHMPLQLFGRQDRA